MSKTLSSSRIDVGDKEERIGKKDKRDSKNVEEKDMKKQMVRGKKEGNWHLTLERKAGDGDVANEADDPSSIHTFEGLQESFDDLGVDLKRLVRRILSHAPRRSRVEYVTIWT